VTENKVCPRVQATGLFSQLSPSRMHVMYSCLPVSQYCVSTVQSLGIVSTLDETEFSPSNSCEEIDTRYAVQYMRVAVKSGKKLGLGLRLQGASCPGEVGGGGGGPL